MQSRREMPLPFIDGLKDDDTKTYLRQFTEQVSDQFRRMHDDINLGLGSYKVGTAVPATSDLERGQIQFYTSGGTNYLAVRITNNIRKVALT